MHEHRGAVVTSTSMQCQVGAEEKSLFLFPLRVRGAIISEQETNLGFTSQCVSTRGARFVTEEKKKKKNFSQASLPRCSLYLNIHPHGCSACSPTYTPSTPPSSTHPHLPTPRLSEDQQLSKHRPWVHSLYTHTHRHTHSEREAHVLHYFKPLAGEPGVIHLPLLPALLK